METAAEDGLRERKRAALRAAIESAALDLVLEHGYENVTVDMICEAATVSQRTFFNYFGSKEGVILGTTPPLPGDEEIDLFVHRPGTNVLGDFIAMLAASLVDHEPDLTLLKARRRVIMQTPDLASKEMARVNEYEDGFVRIVLARFTAQGRGTELEDEARMVVALATGVMRYIFRKWFGDQTVATRDLLNDSIALIRRITGDGASHPE